MDQNPQNQNNNNDLDSLLQEFQTLSTPVEEVNPNMEERPVASVQPVQPVNVEPRVVPTQPVQQVNVEPQAVPTQPAQPAVTPVQPEVASINPVPVSEPVTQPTIEVAPIIEEPIVHPDMEVKLGEVKEDIPSNPEVPVQPNLKETPTPGGKGNLIFMIVIFIIMAAFIFFIPTINDFIKNKPGIEPKPTATPSATPSAKPVIKELKTDCTIDDTVNGDVTTKTSYTYHSLDGKVNKTKKTVSTVFANIEGTNKALYDQTKLTCDSLATTYAGIAGYSVTCEEKDNTFTIVYAFDLASFTNPTTITLNGKQETIKSDINLNDDIATVKANLTSVGATCK